MKHSLFIITFLGYLSTLIVASKEDSIVKPSDVEHHAMTLIPSPHGAVFIATPYDTALAAHFLEKSGIPPQFNGIKGYANPNDYRLPETPKSSPKPTTPNPSFSAMSKHLNPETKYPLKKRALKDITHD